MRMANPKKITVESHAAAKGGKAPFAPIANPTEYVLIEGIEKAESEIKKIQDLAISRYIETRIKDSAERFPATTIATNGKIDFMKNENKQTLQNGL